MRKLLIDLREEWNTNGLGSGEGISLEDLADDKLAEAG